MVFIRWAWDISSLAVLRLSRYLGGRMLGGQHSGDFQLRVGWRSVANNKSATELVLFIYRSDQAVCFAACVGSRIAVSEMELK